MHTKDHAFFFSSKEIRYSTIFDVKDVILEPFAPPCVLVIDHIAYCL